MMRNFFFSFFLLISLPVFSAESYLIDGIYYTLDLENAQASVVAQSHDGSSKIHYSGDIVIPSTIRYFIFGIERSFFVCEIEDSAFADDADVTSIQLPPTITTIGESAFSGCIRLQSINIPPLITTIEKLTFSQCRALTTIDLPEGISSIGYRAFNGCSALTHISLPAALTTIADGAFRGCKALSKIEVHTPAVVSIADTTFPDEVFADAEVSVPAEVLPFYRDDAVWSKFHTLNGISNDAVPSVFSDPANPVSYYDLFGNPTTPTSRGIYILRRGSKSFKFLY